MNKTFTINLNGKVYNINDDAFDTLSAYLNNLKNRFANEEGAQEIMDDIEARIGELFTERMRYGMQVVTLQDVDDVIAIMGQPEEIEQADNGFSFSDDEAKDNVADEADKTDEVKPEQADTQTGKRKKRLFRDPDDMIIAGLCSGIGSYFDVDPWVFRAIFIVTFLLGFGSPILIYAVLWIIIPEAKTVAQKLQMKGEEANVENISKAINEGEAVTGSRKSALSEVLGYIFKFIAVIAGSCLGFFVLVLLFFFAMASFPFLFSGMIGYESMVGNGFNYLTVNFDGNPVLMFVAILVAIAVPFYKLLNMVLVRSKNIKPISTEANWTRLVIWLIALGVILFRVF